MRVCALMVLPLFFAFGTPAGAVVPEGCVDVFEHPDFQGAVQRFCGEGHHWLPYDPAAGVDWHYRVSSFECGRGVELVRFVNGNLPGSSATLECAAGMRGLVERQFDDSATDLEIVDISPGCALLFDQPEGRGDRLEICGDGHHWLPYAPGVVDWHYRVSSFFCGEHVDRLTLIDGNRAGRELSQSCRQGRSLPSFDDSTTDVMVQSVPADCVRMYEHGDLLGESLQVCGDGHHWLPYTPGGVDWHYRASSFVCGPGVGTVRFIDGNSPGAEVELSCLGTDELGLRFDDRTTDIEVHYAFDCQPWDGSFLAVGSRIRLTNSVVSDSDFLDISSRYRTDPAGRYLVNTYHGDEPVPKFVAENPESRATLYEVVGSRLHADGPEVRLRAPTGGIAPGSILGFSGGSLTTSAHSYQSIDSDWLRLAHTYRCYECVGYQGTKSPPLAVLHRIFPDEGWVCNQTWEWEPSSRYQTVQCRSPWVLGSPGEASSLGGEVLVEVCQVR